MPSSPGPFSQFWEKGGRPEGSFSEFREKEGRNIPVIFSSPVCNLFTL